MAKAKTTGGSRKVVYRAPPEGEILQPLQFNYYRYYK